MAIDPTGRGDVSKTHIRMHVAPGGPYVISPLLYPGLLLPGDNGAIRGIDQKGRTILKMRVQGHFTASPVAGVENRESPVTKRMERCSGSASKVFIKNALDRAERTMLTGSPSSTLQFPFSPRPR